MGAVSRADHVIDLHSRILPGLDDGATDLAGALEIARAAVADGITAIAATRHVREDYPTTADAMEGGVRQLRTALERDGIELELQPGGEVSPEQLDRLSHDELRRFGLGGNGNYLLIETPGHRTSRTEPRCPGRPPKGRNPRRCGCAHPEYGRVPRR